MSDDKPILPEIKKIRRQMLFYIWLGVVVFLISALFVYVPFTVVDVKTDIDLITLGLAGTAVLWTMGAVSVLSDVLKMVNDILHVIVEQ
jgi:hypothetical protein